MVSIPKSVEARINSLLKDYGVKIGDGAVLHNLSLTDIPKDAYWTDVFHQRAKYEAKDLDSEFLCFICGKEYDDVNELTACIDQHMKEFNAGIPIKRTDEHVERLLKNIHPKDHEKMRKILKGEG